MNRAQLRSQSRMPTTMPPVQRIPRPDPPKTITWSLVPPEERAPRRGSGHLHWTVTAFMEQEGDLFKDAIAVDVEAADEWDALSQAMWIVERAHYRVSSVRETCSLDEALRD